MTKFSPLENEARIAKMKVDIGFTKNPDEVKKSLGVYEAAFSEVVKSEWVKFGPKHFSHVSGVQVKYDHNAWAWQVIGGAKCGTYYKAKWEAQTEALKTA